MWCKTGRRHKYINTHSSGGGGGLKGVWCSQSFTATNQVSSTTALHYTALLSQQGKNYVKTHCYKLWHLRNIHHHNYHSHLPILLLPHFLSKHGEGRQGSWLQITRVQCKKILPFIQCKNYYYSVKHSWRLLGHSSYFQVISLSVP